MLARCKILCLVAVTLCAVGCSRQAPPQVALIEAPVVAQNDTEPAQAISYAAAEVAHDPVAGISIVSPAETVIEPAATQITDQAIVALLMRQSRASYSGSCPCPESVDSGGRRCGARSAYSKPGGASPLCYPHDVSSDMVAAYRASVTSAGASVPAAPVAFAPARRAYGGGGCAENGSCYGDYSASTGRAKTVRVGGYHRKDGTYVRGHYRSR